MLNQLNSLMREINYLKRKLQNLWKLKGETDQEILDLSQKIDILLNKYYLLKYSRYINKRDS